MFYKRVLTSFQVVLLKICYSNIYQNYFDLLFLDVAHDTVQHFSMCPKGTFSKIEKFEKCIEIC